MFSIEEIYFQPCSQYIASLFQFSNILQGTINSENIIKTTFNNIKINRNARYTHVARDGLVNYVIRPENIVIDKRGQNALIKEIKFFGSYYILILKLENLDQLLFMKIEKLNDEIQINKTITINLNLVENELIVF